MKKNENSADRTARITIGLLALIAAFVWLDAIGGSILGFVAGLIGLVLIGTGLAGYCPLYRLIGVSTCRACGEQANSVRHNS